MIPAAGWTAEAACRGLSPAEADAIFFPTGNSRWHTNEIERYCGACPVRMACRESAMEEESDIERARRFGWRGGLSPEARYRLADRRRRWAS